MATIHGEHNPAPPKKKKPTPVPKKPSADARSFGAHTAIFVPPELQHETGPKPKPAPPKSVVIRVPKRTESTSEKKARLARETHARERLRIGLHISSPTGENDTRAVPDRIPRRSRVDLPFGLGHFTMYKPAHDIALGLGLAGKAAAIKGAKGTASWAQDVADIPGDTLAAIMDQTPSRGPRMSPLPVPPRVAQVGQIASATEPAFRPLGKSASYIGSEHGQQAIWGNSLVNLVAHGDTPGSKGEVAGLTLGIIGILPFGKLGQLARLGKAAAMAGHIGEALPDSEARTAWKAVLSQRLGEEKANDLILLIDNVARNTAKKGEDPLKFYEKTTAHASNADEFVRDAKGRNVKFQTGPGPRRGLVEQVGKARWMPNPNGEFLPAAGDMVQTGNGEVGLIEDTIGTTAKIRTEDGKQIDHYMGDVISVVPDTSPPEVPVFYSPLQRKVAAEIPDQGLTKTETIKALAPNKKPTSTKEAEWADSGMQDFLDGYAHGEVIPKADIQSHLSTSLNAYNVDEVIRSSESTQHGARYGERTFGALTVKDSSEAEPYFEITMKLRAPLHKRIAKSVMGGGERVKAPYTGKGLAHWGEPDVIAHVRFHVITDNEGKTALLVDEIQSDWASQFRDFTRRGGKEGIEARLPEIQKQLDRVVAEAEQIENAPGGGEVDIWELEDEMRVLEQERGHLKSLLRDVPGAPPLGKKQMEAAVRRTIRYASDAGVDRIIITRGDVQAIRNTAYGKTPKGNDINLYDTTLDVETSLVEAQRWGEDVAGMSQAEVKAFANDPANKETGTAKTFFRLYGDDINKGQVPEMFEKEMGEQGVVKKGIFDGGYADGAGHIKRDVHHPMDGFVIEMTPGAKAKAAAPMSYYQSAPDLNALPRGATEFFADGTQAMHLFEGADVSTVIHELAHVARGDINEVDRAILNRHFGNLDDAKNVAAHEAYARALERYVYEGQAMSSELDGVFSKLKTWMAAVYQHVNNIGAHVHPEVKQVFDRMMVKPETPGQQLVRMLKAAPPVRKAQEIGYTAERAKRIGDAMDAMETGGVEGFIAAKAALKGTLPKEEFTGLDELSPEAVDSLLNTIFHHPYTRGYEKVRAMDAIVKATKGEVPTHSELLLLEKIFGKEVGFKKVEHSGVVKVMLELINLPRSIAASFDLSAPFRQGLVAGARHPNLFRKNLVPMVKAMRKVNSEDLAEEIAMRPSFPLMQRAKLAVETHATNPWAQREEQFYSSYADRMWGVKHSARAYEGFLHKMRADVFDHMLAAAVKKNIDVNDQQFLEGLGVYVNQITGRGVMPKTEVLDLESAAPALNTLLFSPRLLASRVNMISPFYYRKLWQADPFIAKQAMRSAVQTLGVTASILFIASEMPGVTVGIDPTSANFGKIRIGDTRVDILGGFQPLLVFIFREALGKSTSSSTGKTQNLRGGYGSSSRWDIGVRFLESKFAPTPGIARDLAMNQTFIGQPVTWKNEGANFIPMVWRDAWDTAQESNDPTTKAMGAVAAIVLGGLGLGFTSYANKVAKTSGGGSEPTGGVPEGWDNGGTGGGAPEGWDDGGTGGGLPEGW